MLDILSEILGSLANPLVLGIVIVTSLIILVTAELIRRGRYTPHFRPIGAYEAVTSQLSRVVESGGRAHISVGPTGIGGEETAITVAATLAMREVAKRASVSDRPPVVTTSDATALPLISDVLYRSYQQQSATARYERSSTRLVALDRSTLAAGLTGIIPDDNVQANVLAGSFSEEVALITEAGQRRNMGQTVGSDRIEGIAAGYAGADHVLIGEEVFVASAYVNEGTETDLASVTAADILRLATIGGILIGALLTAVGVL